MALKINLKNDINNASLQIGDSAYFVDSVNSMGDFGEGTNSLGGNDPKLIGVITSKGASSITIESPSCGPTEPPDNAFIMFQKDRSVNNTSLLGYYAEVKLINNSTEKAELFALSSEITASSK